MSTYTTPDDIGLKLGVTLSPEQAAQAEVVAAAVTAWIDEVTGQSWQAASPIVGETRAIIAPPCLSGYDAARVSLSHAGATTVSAVSVRSTAPNAALTELDPSQYELRDGVLYLAPFWSSSFYGTASLAVVDYSCDPSVPADIIDAATTLAADMLTVTLHPESAGLESISVAQNDVSVRYSGAGGTLTADVSQARAVIFGHRRVVVA
jgi:hypothetical protein